VAYDVICCRGDEHGNGGLLTAKKDAAGNAVTYTGVGRGRI